MVRKKINGLKVRMNLARILLEPQRKLKYPTLIKCLQHKNMLKKLYRIGIWDIFRKNLKFGETSLVKTNNNNNQNKMNNQLNKNSQPQQNRSLSPSREKIVT